MSQDDLVDARELIPTVRNMLASFRETSPRTLSKANEFYSWLNSPNQLPQKVIRKKINSYAKSIVKSLNRDIHESIYQENNLLTYLCFLSIKLYRFLANPVKHIRGYIEIWKLLNL